MASDRALNASPSSPVTSIPSFSSHLMVQTSLVPSSVSVCQPDLDNSYVPAHFHSDLELYPSIRLLLLNTFMRLQALKLSFSYKKILASIYIAAYFFVLTDPVLGKE